MKSKNTDEIINLMANQNVDAIIYGATSSSPILNLNAVLFGAKYKIKSEEFISALKNKFSSSDEHFFGMSFSKIAAAALDVLGVEKYSGKDNFILNLISSDFNIV